MSDIHIGHTDDEGYELFGKLADGTPVYKWSPERLQMIKEKVAREKREKAAKTQQKTELVIDNYNVAIEYKSADTGQFLEQFNREELQDQEQQKNITQPKVDTSKIELTEDKHNVLGYYDSTERPTVEDTNEDVDQYTDLFRLEEVKAEEKRKRCELIESNIRKREEEKKEKALADATKYKALSDSLREKQAVELKEYQATIEEIEVLLQDDYQKLLNEDEFEDFYVDGDEYNTEVQVHTNNIIVTNNRTDAKKHFNYIGNLQSVNVKEHRLVLYSVVRGDDGYGILREGYSYITHRSITYNLRTGRIMGKESSIVSKVDPLRSDKITGGGITSHSIILSAQGSASNNCTPECWWEWTEPTEATQIKIEPMMIPFKVSQKDEPDRFETRQVIPTEFVIQAWGSGGAGLSGLGDPQVGGPGINMNHPTGAPGGGGAYAEKRYWISPLQRYPIRVTINVGTSQWLEPLSGYRASTMGGRVEIPLGSNDDHVWDTDTIRPERDTYAIVYDYQTEDVNRTISPPITTCACGGYDGDNWSFFEAGMAEGWFEDWPFDESFAGWPGKPIGEYDIGYYGFGFKPWSTMKYFLSAYITGDGHQLGGYGGSINVPGPDEEGYSPAGFNPDKYQLELENMARRGWGGNGATCTGPGVGTSGTSMSALVLWDPAGLNPGPRIVEWSSSAVYGTSGGMPAHGGVEALGDERCAATGQYYTGGGGAGYGMQVKTRDEAGAPLTVYGHTSGAPGGQGKIAITITKGIVSRDMIGDRQINADRRHLNQY